MAETIMRKTVMCPRCDAEMEVSRWEPERIDRVGDCYVEFTCTKCGRTIGGTLIGE